MIPIHEYQAKAILKPYGVPLLPGVLVEKSQGARDVVRSQGFEPPFVVKAQVHAGARGKAGGIRLITRWDDFEPVVEGLLGRRLVTAQTGPEGQFVRALYVEGACSVQREFYVAFVVDRVQRTVSLVVSDAGGMDIETVAHEHPDRIITYPIDREWGIASYQVRRLGLKWGLTPLQVQELERILKGLYRAFWDYDMALLEINPLVLDHEGRWWALDVKVNLDQNGWPRQPALQEFRDPTQVDPIEWEAQKWDLSYIKLSGNIGCLVNGAGLAMATLDILKFYGGEPANFLDVGGGADTQKVTQAFEIILRDSAVKAILVNIFGGIMKCDVIAQGVLTACHTVGLKVPLVVRLQGTRVDEGYALLKESGLPIQVAADLDEAARLVVQAAQGSG